MMPDYDEIPDMSEGLPTLEDYQAATGTTGTRRGVGRPRQNPYATQETLRKIQVEYNKKAKARLNDARKARKAEVDVYVEAVFDAHPEIQALLISVVNHVFTYAQRDEAPLTDFDARQYVTLVVGRHLKHMISPKATIEFLKTHHVPETEAPEPVTESVEEPVTEQPAPAEPVDEIDEMEALMAGGLPGGDYEDEATGGTMTYPDDWRMG